MKISLQSVIWSVVLVGIVATLFFAAYTPPIQVETAEVVSRQLKVTVQEDGIARNREKYVVSSPVVGRLTRIQLNPGDEIVAEETLLAVILPSEPQMLDTRSRAVADARLSAAEASVERAQANLEQVRAQAKLHDVQLDRAKRLRESNAIAQNDLDEADARRLGTQQALRKAQFDSDIASFERDMAKAALIQFSDPDAAANLDPFEIHAPVSGKILRRFEESSTVISVGTPLLELGDPENLELVIDVLSTDAVRIQPGAEVIIDHWGGERPLAGVVRVVEPAAFTKVSSLGVEEQRVNVIVDFLEAPYRFVALGDGYRVEAEITIDQKPEVVRIPNSALFRVGKRWHVFKIVDQRVTLSEVELGLQSDTHAEVRAGLETGDQVVVYPMDQLKSGMKIAPIVGDD